LQASTQPPNLIIIFTDDQGYNDVGAFGSKLIKTPHLDRMAAEGMRFTDFYVAAPVCTPSRAALMTGCYPQRVGLAAIPWPDGRPGSRAVLFPSTPYGLHENEITIANIAKEQGYATACVGKWHLGHLPEFLPTERGFDSYFGIPYSNDMKPTPLMRDGVTLEEPVDQTTLTERYTEESIRFIKENKDKPFFLYLAHSMPHIPLFVSERFEGRSEGGLYGDVIETIDWGVGEILRTLEELDIDDNTWVVFTSDNGPWLVMGERGGNASPLRAGKGTTYEGGMRVPCIMRWPDGIPAGSVCGEVATAMDILPTFAKLAGATAPTDRVIDGHDIAQLLHAEPGAESPTEAFFYYFKDQLNAVRSGPWKLKFQTTLRDEDIYRRYKPADAPIPEALYNLDTDIGEQRSVIKDYPEVVERLRAYAEQARAALGDSRTGREGSELRPIGTLTGG
jgi:arylsulfatase